MPAEVRLNAVAASPTTVPAADGATAVMRIRELTSAEPIKRPASQQIGRGAPTERMRLPADAKLVRTIDVTVPVGPPFATSTRFGTTTLRVGGKLTVCKGEERYRTLISYGDEWPIKPGKLPKNCRGFATHWDLKPGEEEVVAGLASAGGQSLFAVTVLPKTSREKLCRAPVAGSL
jgi:hypothetical protein